MARAPTLLALLLALSVGASAQGNYPGDAVRVNGQAISYQRFNGFYEEHRRAHGVAIGARGDQLPLLVKIRREAMDKMVEQELVCQAAEEKGIEVSDQAVEAEVEALREIFDSPASFAARLQNEGYTEESYRTHMRRMIAAKRYLDQVRAPAMRVSDEDLQAYYDANRQRLTLPEQARVRHILLTWKPMGKGDDRAAIRQQMLPILQRARSGEDFAALAREFSEDSATAKAGGDTGLFHRGQMVPAFERAAFALEPGEISDMVESPYGIHILRGEEHRPARLLPLDEVREQLREHVANERAEKAEEEEIARLKEGAEIQILIPLGPREPNTRTSRR